MHAFTHWLTTVSAQLAGWLNDPSANPLVMLLVALAGGILVSLTPCVYPVIPLTVGFFGAQGGASHMRVILYAGVYILGLAAVYTLLGLLAGLTGSTFGQLSSSPWINLIVGNIILLCGLSMLGVFNINFAFAGSSSVGHRANLTRALIMGLTAGIVIAPCGAPVLVVLLTLVAKGGQPVWGALLLFVHALGIGLLFLVIAIFSGALSRLPRNGLWMERLKHAFGWIMILMAQVFIVLAGKYMLSSSGTTAAGATHYVLAAEPAAGAPQPGQQLAALTFKHPELAISKIADHLGRDVVWITLWASWCAACKEEVPVLNSLFSRFREQGFVVYGVNHQDDLPIAASEALKTGMQYPIIVDEEGWVFDAWEVQALPFNVILDRQGVVRYAGLPMPANPEEFIRSLLEEASSSLQPVSP